MAAIPPILASKLARSAEAKLRSGSDPDKGIQGWQSMTEGQLGWWLFKQQPPGGEFTYSQYRTIARQTIRNARDAATMMANPSFAIGNLGRSPGVPANYPNYEYRVIVVGYDRSGNEIYSTLTYVYSNQEIDANAVKADALQKFAMQNNPPGFRQSEIENQGGIVSYDAFIVSAGKR